MADYKNYANTSEVKSTSPIVSSVGGGYAYTETVEYKISEENYRLLLTDLQNQRDALAATDVSAAIAALDTEIATVSAISE